MSNWRLKRDATYNACPGQLLGLPTWLWRERAGDAAFHAQSYREAHGLYEASMKENRDNTSVLLKLSDVYFIFGDLEKEQSYREKVYGTLRVY